MSFTVGGVVLNYETNNKSPIYIKSRSKNYTVNFGKNIPNVKPNDILVIDKKVSELYDVTSHFDKVITINAIEDKKDMDSVLGIVDKLANFNVKKSDTMHVYGGGITQD